MALSSSMNISSPFYLRPTVKLVHHLNKSISKRVHEKSLISPKGSKFYIFLSLSSIINDPLVAFAIEMVI